MIAGNVVWRADYKPFGEEQSITRTIENNEKFVGKEKDKETGLYYSGARYMRPEIGRFISPDPLSSVDPRTSKTNEALLLSPQKLNTYVYSLNNPYRYIDPDGKTVWDIADFAFFSYSFYKFVKDPSWSTAGELGLDTVGLLPVVPSLGTIKRVGKGLNKIDDVIKSEKTVKSILRVGEKELILSEHALYRMTQRGVSVEEAQSVISKSAPFEYFHEGVWKKGYYDPESKIFIGEFQGKITTVITNVRSQYVENLKKIRP